MTGRGSAFRPPIGPLARTEVRLQRRHRVLAATGGLTAAWVALLLVVPAPVRAALVPWILLLDLAAVGLFVVPALALLERANAIPAALGVARLSPLRAMTVRLGVVTVLALLAAVPVIAVARPAAPIVVMAGVGMTSLLASLLGLVALGTTSRLGTWMSRLPLVAAPLLAPALVHGIRLWDAPVLALSPFTVALDLLAGMPSAPGAAWLLAWTAGLAVMARHQAERVTPGSTSSEPITDLLVRVPHARTRRAAAIIAAEHEPGRWRGRALRSMARVDARTVLADGMVLAMLAGIPLLALAVRWFAGPGGAWLRATHGIEAGPLLPLATSFVVVVHAPTIVGAVSGLLWSEDRDANVLPAVALTRASLPTLLILRSLGTVLAATAVVAVGLVLAGTGHPGGAASLAATAVAAGATALVPMLVLAVLAADRVQAVALVKLVTLPLYLPLATWFVAPPWDDLAVLFPTGWALHAAWATTPGAAWLAAAGATAWSVGAAWWLARRLVRAPLAT